MAGNATSAASALSGTAPTFPDVPPTTNLPSAPDFPDVPAQGPSDVGGPNDALVQSMAQGPAAGGAKPAAPHVTNPFEGLVRGALMGMGMASLNKQDFFGGMGRAMLAQQQMKQQQVENQQKQEQLDTQSKLADASVQTNTAKAQLDRANAAKAMIDMLHTEAIMKQMPEEEQRKVSQTLGEIQSAYLKAGYGGTEIDNTPQARTAYLQQMKQEGVDVGNVIFTTDPDASKLMVFRPDPTKLIKPEDANNVAQQLGLTNIKFSQPVDPRVFNSLTTGAVREMTTQMAQDAANQRNAASNATRLKAAEIGAAGKGLVDPSTPEGQSLVDSIGTGRVAFQNLQYLATRNPQLLSAVTQKYPDFQSAKVGAYIDAYKDFVSGKTSVALNAGNTALDHLYELYQLANSSRTYIPGTAEHARYQNLVGTVGHELGKFYGNTTVSSSSGFTDQLNSAAPWRRTAEIQQQAQAMGDKLDSFKQQWANAIPSKAYMAQMPDISDKAKQERAILDPNYKPDTQPQVDNGNPFRKQQPAPGAAAPTGQ